MDADHLCAAGGIQCQVRNLRASRRPSRGRRGGDSAGGP